MASTEGAHRHDAHYHAIKVTEAWAAFQAGMRAAALDPPAEREARDAQRHRETTYARGVLGGS